MIKCVRSSDTTWNEPAFTLVNCSSRGVDNLFMEKVGSASPLAAEFANLSADPKYAWVYGLSIGSTEGYGPNRNGDGFREKVLQRCHPTFLKFAKVYENHQNKDPRKAIGILKASAYNDEMRRHELIYGIDKVKGKKYVEKAARGEDLDTSMGCKVPHDVCSICGHVSPTPKTYCKHAKDMMCQILDDGRQVYVDNPDALFFDHSLVPRHADRVAYQFGVKAASDGGTEYWVSSVELAKQAGIYIPVGLLDGEGNLGLKMAVIRKLSEIEKEISTGLKPIDVKMGPALKDGCISDSTAALMKKHGLDMTFAALNEAGVILGPRDFFKVVTAGIDDDTAAEIQHILPGIYSRMEGDTEILGNDFFDGEGNSGLMAKVAQELVPELGLREIPLRNRMMTALWVPKVARISKSSDFQEVEVLADLYATYKLAALSHSSNRSDVVLTRAAILQHYTHLQ
jgi:hypothetical protein